MDLTLPKNMCLEFFAVNVKKKIILHLNALIQTLL